ncbi:hypothetical protein BTUL_0091g00090 [Botrytis tulipae]|uniref:BTB domain-containing protein n=1 Tax=Botrytis tulipae TaxID=87230 RepID=A0A4Z1EIQ7_9HELO|nr:hypothetical protein BTUL_0091g00090 [Botrytis tulipae]
MASDTLEAVEKLIFDAKGGVLLIFTQRSKSDAETETSSSESGSRKRKRPDDDSKTVTMLVSSKHLILASPVFDAMIGDARFKEGAELLACGKVEIKLPDDDPDAFAIVANVIHHRNKMVPEEISFQSFVKVAIITEKYQISGAMRWVSKEWFDNLPYSIHNKLGNLYALIFTSVVFGNACVFERHTRRAILHSKGNFGANIKDDYYFRPSIIDAIKAARTQALSDIFDALNSFIKRGTEPLPYCDDRHDICGIMTTGSFLRSVNIDIGWPFPPAPYTGTNLFNLHKCVSKLSIRTLCAERRKFGEHGGTLAPGLGCKNQQMFTKMIEVQIKELERKIVGLDIEKFQQKVPAKGDLTFCD